MCCRDGGETSGSSKHHRLGDGLRVLVSKLVPQLGGVLLDDKNQAVLRIFLQRCLFQKSDKCFSS